MVQPDCLGIYIPTLVLYGGGYNLDREHTARLHAASVLRAAAYA